MLRYNPRDWYWIIDGDGKPPRLWSSASNAFLETDNAAYVAWSAGNPTSRLSSEDELAEVLEGVVPDFVPLFPAGLLRYAARVRLAKEQAGITINGAVIDTGRLSQSMIANAFAYVTASGAPSVTYKSASGWVTLTSAQIAAIALTVGAHVQACFAKECEVAGAIMAAPPTIASAAQIDAAFA